MNMHVELHTLAEPVDLIQKRTLRFMLLANVPSVLFNVVR